MPAPRAERPSVPGVALLLTAALVACLSAVCGIGGGLFAVPILHYLLGVPLKRAVATALCLVASVAFSATVSEFLHPQSALIWPLIAVLVGSSVVGTQLGFALARKLRVRALKGLFCLVLLGVGLRIALGQFADAGVGEPAVALAASEYAIIAAIGLLAGAVVPLLGVGGGLIVVPSILLGLPHLGWHAARAASLAMAVVASSRSLRLYQRDSMVDWSLGRWFALGGVLGAYLGVRLVHVPGVAQVAQVLLGIVLVFAALRFGLDFARGDPDERAPGGSGEERAAG